jgi:hypothetical protein
LFALSRKKRAGNAILGLIGDIPDTYRSSFEDIARAVAIQADGKIVAVGGSGGRGMEMARYQ